MSLAELKQKAVMLSSSERDELMAFLAMRIAADQELRSELTRKIDDKDPANWIDFDKLKERWAN